VFRGNDVRDECGMSLCVRSRAVPAAMVAGEVCDLFGLLNDRVIEQADATQAYAQSLVGGTPTWVSSPREEWPQSWKHMRRPFCPFEKAWCGRPAAGGYWEQLCGQHVKDCGFDPVALDDKSWRSFYLSAI
jgi:hypothetical protein